MAYHNGLVKMVKMVKMVDDTSHNCMAMTFAFVLCNAHVVQHTVSKGVCM